MGACRMYVCVLVRMFGPLSLLKSTEKDATGVSNESQRPNERYTVWSAGVIVHADWDEPGSIGALGTDPRRMDSKNTKKRRTQGRERVFRRARVRSADSVSTTHNSRTTPARQSARLIPPTHPPTHPNTKGNRIDARRRGGLACWLACLFLQCVADVFTSINNKRATNGHGSTQVSTAPNFGLGHLWLPVRIDSLGPRALIHPIRYMHATPVDRSRALRSIHPSFDKHRLHIHPTP